MLTQVSDHLRGERHNFVVDRSLRLLTWAKAIPRNDARSSYAFDKSRRRVVRTDSESLVPYRLPSDILIRFLEITTPDRCLGFINNFGFISGIIHREENVQIVLMLAERLRKSKKKAEDAKEDYRNRVSAADAEIRRGAKEHFNAQLLILSRELLLEPKCNPLYKGALINCEGQVGYDVRPESLTSWFTICLLLEFCGEKFCPICGETIRLKATGRPRKFCIICSNKKDKKRAWRESSGNLPETQSPEVYK